MKILTDTGLLMLWNKIKQLVLGNRPYEPTEFSGKGYKVLEKNIQTVDGVKKNILTAVMLSEENTIYEIRYDFDLNGETIEMQEGCTLKFCGGSLKNGTIRFNNSYLCGNVNILTELNGTIKNDYVYIDWFGAEKNNVDFDNSIIFYKLFNLENNKSFDIILSVGIYYISNKIELPNNTKFSILGENLIETIIKPNKPVEYIFGLANKKDNVLVVSFNNLTIDGNRTIPESDINNVNKIFNNKSLAECGLLLGNKYNYITLSNIRIRNIDGPAIQANYLWSTLITKIYILNCYYGILCTGFSNILTISKCEIYNSKFIPLVLDSDYTTNVLYNCIERNGGCAILAYGDVNVSYNYFENNCINYLSNYIAIDNNSAQYNLPDFKTYILICRYNYDINTKSLSSHLSSYGSSVYINCNSFQSSDINSYIITLSASDIVIENNIRNNKINLLSTFNLEYTSITYTIRDNVVREAWNNIYKFSDNINIIYLNNNNELYNRTKILGIIDDDTLIKGNLINKLFDIDIYRNYEVLPKATSEGKKYNNNEVFINSNNRNLDIVLVSENTDITEYENKYVVIKYYIYNDTDNSWHCTYKTTKYAEKIQLSIPINKKFTLPECYFLGTEITNEPTKLNRINKNVMIGDNKVIYLNYTGIIKDFVPYSNYNAFDGLLFINGERFFKIKNNIIFLENKLDNLNADYTNMLAYYNNKLIFWNGTAWVNMDGTELAAVTSNEQGA